jgi:acyl-coenzyme A thioesterase PaaI-like protein
MTPQSARAFAQVRQAFGQRQPGRAIGRGFAIGDFLEAYDWEVLEEGPGELRLRCRLPARVTNPLGQLFGGFTPTYIDLIALLTCRAGRSEDENRAWIATRSMQIEYVEPLQDGFVAASRVTRRRGAVFWVSTHLLDRRGEPAVLAATCLREQQE